MADLEIKPQYLLAEDGSYVLDENGNKILLDSSSGLDTASFKDTVTLLLGYIFIRLQYLLAEDGTYVLDEDGNKIVLDGSPMEMPAFKDVVNIVLSHVQNVYTETVSLQELVTIGVASYIEDIELDFGEQEYDTATVQDLVSVILEGLNAAIQTDRLTVQELISVIVSPSTSRMDKMTVQDLASLSILAPLGPSQTDRLTVQDLVSVLLGFGQLDPQADNLTVQEIVQILLNFGQLDPKTDNLSVQELVSIYLTFNELAAQTDNLAVQDIVQVVIQTLITLFAQKEDAAILQDIVTIRLDQIQGSVKLDQSTAADIVSVCLGGGMIDPHDMLSAADIVGVLIGYVGWPSRYAIRTKIRSILSEPVQSKWSDAELNIMINNGQRDIAIKTGCYETIAPLSTQIGNRFVDFTGYKVNSVEYVPAGKSRVGLQAITPKHLGHIPVNGDDPQFWFTWGQSIVIEPVPTKVCTLYAYIEDIPPDMNWDIDVPAIPKEFYELLIDYVLSQAFLKIKKWGMAGGHYQRYVEKAQALTTIYQRRGKDHYVDLQVPDIVQRQTR